MKKSIASYLTVSLTISVLLYVSLSSNKVIDSSKYSTAGLVLNYTVSHDAETKAGDLALFNSNKTFSPYLGKSFVGFKEALAFKESRGDYSSVNTLGYLGKYQFGKETLKLIGIYDVEEFLNNPELQERAFIANAERNKWILRRDIKRFVGKKINGILITESGILAAAHLAGPGSVKNYLRSYGLENFSDAYGTSMEYYLKKFSGYDTSFVKPNKNAKAVNS
ncbi:MAG: peptidoglycan-binding protein LysM [Flavobacteriales bacterium]|nr:peptidoglycan-binding protein LysM [Flavobacteriia bacterium]NCP07021.1 peptidoglycan-binding protein LysM [Flavobacteriales bacterium]PIV93539.1 MAG: peptidoglycan-binding protein LysM [Flavobacteriaceae bacterium CG17_big_fil_post_rev_8_21_14_2_50_33_15]PIY09692.1 MAG: peptidoglycan-binding protein LysM [Flavobacteriaceae bacterium CG_4_10_14_3_um_filter_33_47]PJB16578.1 MAG: peptidoglycan-binding protein LysM [Flavobacteriaceae bacterium CG_4_9_14_3_um_filter_33_16]